MSAMHDGWYGIVVDGEGWRPVTDWWGRHWEGQIEARDSDEATHVGYFNGADWEDVEPVDEPEPYPTRRLYFRLNVGAVLGFLLIFVGIYGAIRFFDWLLG